MIAVFTRSLAASNHEQAKSFPSGEATGHEEAVVVSCSGVPPASGTRQTVRTPDRFVWNKTHFPSPLTDGLDSKSPLVSDDAAPPTAVFHKFDLPEREEMNTIEPSGAAAG